MTANSNGKSNKQARHNSYPQFLPCRPGGMVRYDVMNSYHRILTIDYYKFGFKPLPPLRLPLSSYACISVNQPMMSRTPSGV